MTTSPLQISGSCFNLGQRMLVSSVHPVLHNFSSFRSRPCVSMKTNRFLRNGDRLVELTAVRHIQGSVIKPEGLRFAIVVSRFNEIVTRLLLDGALETFRRYLVSDENIDVVWVPGSFEIAVVAQKLGKSQKYEAVLCIGAVIKGETSHYDAVVNSVASGVLSAGLNSGVPCIFGVLTCDNMEQALNRSGGKSGNKGAEAALTSLEMASLSRNYLN